MFSFFLTLGTGLQRRRLATCCCFVLPGRKESGTAACRDLGQSRVISGGDWRIGERVRLLPAQPGAAHRQPQAGVRRGDLGRRRAARLSPLPDRRAAEDRAAPLVREHAPAPQRQRAWRGWRHRRRGVEDLQGLVRSAEGDADLVVFRSFASHTLSLTLSPQCTHRETMSHSTRGRTICCLLHDTIFNGKRQASQIRVGTYPTRHCPESRTVQRAHRRDATAPRITVLQASAAPLLGGTGGVAFTFKA